MKKVALVSALLLTSCRTAPPAVFPGDDWTEAAPESQGMDSAKLREALDWLAAHTGANGTTETVVIRHGVMVWKGPNIERKHSVWSCTKGLTSTAFGLLLEDGKCSLETPAKDILPALIPAYGDVRLRHFLTMTSGYDGQGGSYDKHEGSADANALVPPLAPFFPPGAKFRYWDEAMMQFGSALTAVAGEPLPDYLKRRIFDPIGMKTWTWEKAGAVPNWTGGFSTTARDLARFGLLFLRRGSWNGKQLVDPSWVERATSVQVPASMPFDPISSRQEGPGVYGYNWWVNAWPGAPPRTFAACGFNNNQCFVVPEWDLVFVRMGTDGNVDRKVWGSFFEKLATAIGTS